MLPVGTTVERPFFQARMLELEVLEFSLNGLDLAQKIISRPHGPIGKPNRLVEALSKRVESRLENLAEAADAFGDFGQPLCVPVVLTDVHRPLFQSVMLALKVLKRSLNGLELALKLLRRHRR